MLKRQFHVGFVIDRKLLSYSTAPSPPSSFHDFGSDTAWQRE
jgi:hypothetical protein